MTQDLQFWLIRAKKDWGEEQTFAVSFSANETVSASRAAEALNESFLGDFRVIKVAPVKAPERWDVFDVVPEQIRRRET